MTYKAKKLINDPDDVVTEFIQGLVATYPELHYLNGFPQVKIVLRADAAGGKYDKVAVISGGREPAHAGYVGEGMLTAAICGEVFASPQVDAILAGIRAVTGRMGCLLIVMNYKSDRLNFGLAAEQAKSEGYHVETVIVGDDCALPPPRGIAGRRGLAGTLLVHKVAGAAAAAGLSLAEVAAEAEHASQFVGTMGVALSLCTLPGQVTSDRLGHGEMELGVGIHGERGTVVGLEPVHSVVAHVLKGILSQETKYVPISGGDRVVLMVNGLGGTPLMELMIAASSAVPQLMSKHGLDVDRVYTGSFMPSLDMAGFSISIMKADEAILQRLDAPTKAPSWPVGVDGDRPAIKKPVPMPLASSMKTDELLSFGHICCPIAWMMNKALLCLGSLWVSTDTSNAGSRSIGRPLQLTEQGHTLEAAIEAAANAVIVLASNLNEWDSKVGDSDYGSKMHLCATTILEDMKSYPLNDAAETINEIGSSIRRVMGGTSGILYAILLTAAYARLKANSASVVSPKQWAEALEASIAAVSKYGGAAAGDRTMLDALIPASSVLLERLNAGDPPSTAFVCSSEAALAGAESTKNMKAQAGDSTNVSAEILASVPDPGAMAAASWYRAAALAVEERRQAS